MGLQRKTWATEKNLINSLTDSLFYSLSHFQSLQEREREIKFIDLFGDRGHRSPYGPYQSCNDNLYIGMIIFPHIDNPQSTGYN